MICSNYLLKPCFTYKHENETKKLTVDIYDKRFFHGFTKVKSQQQINFDEAKDYFK